jgi:hypothetical protein
MLEDNIKMIEEIEWERVEWIHKAHDRFCEYDNEL